MTSGEKLRAMQCMGNCMSYGNVQVYETSWRHDPKLRFFAHLDVGMERGEAASACGNTRSQAINGLYAKLRYAAIALLKDEYDFQD